MTSSAQVLRRAARRPRAVEARPLLEPRDGVPPVVQTPAGLATTIAALRAGTGPVAIDAERASGHRYSQRAYLVQLRRAGAGTTLIDPVSLPDLSGLGAALENAEWVLHAASQDLACLADLGLAPLRVFDTELAGRLAGFERVGLASLVETLIGPSLAKEHSAVDWSRRPLPATWLRYAALDVELLVELRDELEAELLRQRKLDWARQEFEAVRRTTPPAVRSEPWRRTSGLHRAGSRRQLAVVRALWEARDELARAADLAPGRVLPDSVLISVALTDSASADEMARLPALAGHAAVVPALWPALSAARQLPETALPGTSRPPEGPPPTGHWRERNPSAAARLARVRAELRKLAQQHRLPVENLLAPAAVRRLAWSPPQPPEPAAVAAALRQTGARGWQVELTAPALTRALREDPPADPIG